MYKTTTHTFDNGYGAIVNVGLGAYEGRDFQITYNGELCQVPEIGRGWWHITEKALDRILADIAALPPKEGER